MQFPCLTVVAFSVMGVASSCLGQLSVPVVAYDNSTAAPSLAFASTDLATKWGDEIHAVAGGTLSEMKFSIFNSGSSAGTLTGATFDLSFYNLTGGTLGTRIGGFSTSLTFQTPLAQGTYSVLTATGLASLGIVLPQDFIVTQQVTAKTGTASRLGIVSLSPVTTGTSPNSYYRSGTGFSSGFYNSTGPVNPIYSFKVLTLAPTPVPEPSTYAALSALGLAGFGVWRRVRR